MQPGGSRRPRVLFVDHVAQLSGGEIAMVRLLEAAGERIEATVVLAQDGPLVAELQRVGARVVVLPMAASARTLPKDSVTVSGVGIGVVLQTLRYTWSLQLMMRRERPDVVHTNSLKSGLYGGVAARLARRPVVWHVRDRIELDYLPRPAMLLVRAFARLVPHGIIANSRATLATVPTAAPSRGRPTIVLHDPLHARTARRPPMRTGPPRIGVVGRLTPWKGQRVFLEAFARAYPDGGADAVVVGSAMFGEDDYAASLEQLAASLGVADRVAFRGYRSDVWAELAELDVLVHCSTTPEPFGQVVVEGMAAGVPVIAADAGGPAEILTDGVDGLLVAPGDVDALAAAMRRLADDPAVGRRLAQAAAGSLHRFAPERAADALLDVYDTLMTARPRVP